MQLPSKPRTLTTILPKVTHSPKASLKEAMEYSFGNDSLKDESPYHLSFQNFTFFPNPTLKPILVLNTCHLPLIAFHTPTQCPSLSTLEHQPPLVLPTITHFQRGSLSLENLQDHLPKRASLRMDKSLMPKPPCCLSNQTIVHLIKCSFCSKTPPPHKNLFKSFLV